MKYFEIEERIGFVGICVMAVTFILEWNLTKEKIKILEDVKHQLK